MTTGTGVGHPTPALPWVDVATGSLGQGLPYGVGIALADQRGPTELEWDMAAYQRRAEAWLGDAG